MNKYSAVQCKDILNADAPYRRRIAVGIIWDTDGEEVDALPNEVEIPESVKDEEIPDYLSDKYEFLVSNIEDIIETEEVLV